MVHMIPTAGYRAMARSSDRPWDLYITKREKLRFLLARELAGDAQPFPRRCDRLRGAPSFGYGGEVIAMVAP